MKFKGSLEVLKELSANTTKLTGINSGYSSSEWYSEQSAVQTVNDTETDIATISLAEGEMVWVKAYVGGAKSDHTEALGAELFCCARRQSSGNVILLGSSVNNILEDSAASPTVSIAADTGSQTVDIRVTGIAGTYNWICSYQYARVLTNA